MEKIQGKHFSITDPKDVRTVVYEVSKTEKELAKNSPKFTIQRLDSTQEFVGERIRKTFYIDDPKPEGNRLAIFSFGKDKVVMFAMAKLMEMDVTEQNKVALYLNNTIN